MLGELLASKLLSGIYNNLIWRAQVGINPAHLKSIPSMLCTDILEPSASLISSSFVDNVQNRLPVNIEDIDNNGVVEIDIVSQVELELTRRLAVSLAIFAVFRKVFQGFLIDVMACSF